MSRMIDINLDPDSETLRKFGFIAFFCFGLLATMAWTESFLFSFGLAGARTVVVGVLCALSVLCLIAGLFYPPANKPIFVGLSAITYPIGIVLSYLIMTVLFFGIIGIIGLLMRVVGYDPMSRTKNSQARSHWVDARPARPKSDYFKQY